MKILVAGATGALGKQLVPRLVARGHDVAGMTRRASKADQVRTLGATPVVTDALDAEAVARAVAETVPEVIVHELTALRRIPAGRYTLRLTTVDRRGKRRTFERTLFLR